jgi:hypothetical protein
MERKGKPFAGLNDDVWMTELALIVEVSTHVN